MSQYYPPSFVELQRRLKDDPSALGYDLDRAIRTAFESIYNVQDQVTSQSTSFTPTVNSVNSTFSATGNSVVRCSTAIAGFTVTLPLANSLPAGTPISVIKTSSDGNTLTVQRSGADVLNGASTWTTTTQYGKARFVTDGVSNWDIF